MTCPPDSLLSEKSALQWVASDRHSLPARHTMVFMLRSLASRPLSILALGALCALAGWGPALAQSNPSGEGKVALERNKRLVKTYRDMLREDPDQAYALRRLLEVSHAVGGLAGLVRLYGDVVAKDPKKYSAWMVLGHIHRAAESVEQAVKAYTKAAALRPKSASPHTAIATLYRKITRFGKALDAYDKAIDLLSRRTLKQDALKAAAETAIQAKQRERAENYFKRLVKTEPRNLFLRMEYAATLARLGELKRSLVLWLEIKRKARAQTRHLVIVWQEVAQLQERLDHLDDAEKTWREALKKTPKGHWSRPSFMEGLIALYRKKDKLRELIAEFEPRSTRSYEVLVTVARLYEELADDDKALKLFRRAVKRRPSDSRARTRMIALLERIGTPAEVIKAYENLVRTNPGEPRHELRLAELFFHQGDVKQGFKRLQSMSRRYREDPGVHQAIIDLTMRYGDVQKRKRIETAYKKLMKLEPMEESHVISLGEYYWSDGRRSRALSTWKKLLKLARAKGEGHHLLAEVYADHNMFREAAASFERAIKADPSNGRYAKAYALMLQKQKRYKMALAQWAIVIKHARKSAVIREARRQIIGLWESDGRLEKEIAQLERRFAATPPEINAGHFLASAYLRLRRTADARRVLERLNTLEPRNIEALTGLEMVYTRLSLIKKAIAILDQLARVNTRSASEYMHRAADLALSDGDDTSALDYMRKVVELNPADPVAHARVGELYLRMGNLSSAAESWRQSLVLDPRNHRVRFKLAGLYRDLGSLLREEQVLSQIVRDAREPADILMAGRRLLQVAGATGRMQAVEGVIRPLVFNRQNKSVYLRLLVEVYALLSQQIAYSDRPRSERRASLRSVGARGIKPLLDALADPDVGLRARALEVLRLTRPPGAAPALARLLSSGDSQLQLQAAMALGQVGTSSAVTALAKLATGRTAASRNVAIWALGLIPNQEAGKTLARQLHTAPSHAQLAALALGRGMHTSAVEALERRLALGNSELLDRALLWALARIAAPRSVPALEAQLLNRDPTRSAMAAWGLGRINTDSAQIALMKALWNPSARAPKAVAAALLTSIVGARNDRGRDEAVVAAYDAIIRLGSGRQKIKPNPRELYSLSRPLRPAEAALSAKRELLHELVMRRARAVLSSGDRQAAQRLLGSLLSPEGDGLVLRPFFPAGSALGAELALKIADANAASIREAAAGAMGRAAQPVAFGLLGVLLDKKVASVARHDVLRIATSVIRDGPPAAKVAAAALLARIATPADKGQVRLVMSALETAGDHWLLRAGLVRALAALRAPESVAVINRLLDDSFAAVRAAAAAAAGALKSPEMIPGLIQLVRDPVTAVAVAACEALKPFRAESRVKRALSWAQSHGNTRVSAAAAKVSSLK